LGTAQIQGELWGAKARDWADVQEPTWQPVYKAFFKSIGDVSGARLLDIGCGAGGALMAAREAGAEVCGIDISEALVTIARARLPGSEVTIGDMQALPYPDEAFDFVVAIDSFRFAEDQTQAFAEACRVCRIGGTVTALEWGPAEDCDLILGALPPVMELLPRPPLDTPAPLTFCEPGVIQGLMEEAGLCVADAGSLSHAFVYTDLITAIRAINSAAPVTRAVRHSGEALVQCVIEEALAPFVESDGSVRLDNSFVWVAARR
jgi:ubiquinone/menaquinone biosynthesis C-methylase UbiE